MDFERLIKENINNPEELERLYRTNEKEFIDAFGKVFSENQDSIVLKVWNARLNYSLYREKTEKSFKKISDLSIILMLSFLGGLFLEIPNFLKYLNIYREIFYIKNMPIIILFLLSIFYIVKNTLDKRKILIISIAFIFSFIYINSLPELKDSQTIYLTYLHLPVFLWFFLGLSFAGDYKDLHKRIAYIRYNGELLIYSGILLICLTILTGFTIFLFNVIDLKIENFYMDYIIVFLFPSIPLIGTYLTEKKEFSKNFAPIIARIFAPMVLITLVIYLLTMLILRKSPYKERETLITFDFMLLIVLGLVIFTISERKRTDKSIIDYLIFSLISISLIIDVIALSAIIFRLYSFGLTPNRSTALLINILMFINLLGIVINYIRFFRKKSGLETIVFWIAKYLPVYSVYAFIISFIFPIIFSFK